jgi:hypothetical protein
VVAIDISADVARLLEVHSRIHFATSKKKSRGKIEANWRAQLTLSFEQLLRGHAVPTSRRRCRSSAVCITFGKPRSVSVEVQIPEDTHLRGIAAPDAAHRRSICKTHSSWPIG